MPSLVKTGFSVAAGGAGLAGKAAMTKTGLFALGGAAMGAMIGSAYADDSTSGAITGAEVGAGVGLATRAVIPAISHYRAVQNTSLVKFSGKLTGGKVGKMGGKLAVSSVAVLGTLGLAVGVHSMMNGPTTGSYASNGDDGDTRYSDSPIRNRSKAMNANGGLVFGLHRKRRG